jgi:hypothetical protein
VKVSQEQAADVPGHVIAHAYSRGRPPAAVLVRLQQGEQAQERWLLPEALVERDPLHDVAG